jgi:hypothetical protein
MPYITVRVPQAARHTARGPLPQWGWSTPMDVELQALSSQITSPTEVLTPERHIPRAGRAGDAGMDPAMELGIDDRTLPVRIRIAGRLDSSTSPSLLALLDQLLAQGVRHFLLDAGGLEIGGAWGAAALSLFQQRVHDAGESLIWEGIDLGHPLTDRTDSSSGAIKLRMAGYTDVT